MHVSRNPGAVQALADCDGWDPWELVHFIVVEPGDTVAALVAQQGRSVLITNATGV